MEQRLTKIARLLSITVLAIATLVAGLLADVTVGGSSDQPSKAIAFHDDRGN